MERSQGSNRAFGGNGLGIDGLTRYGDNGARNPDGDCGLGQSCGGGNDGVYEREAQSQHTCLTALFSGPLVTDEEFCCCFGGEGAVGEQRAGASNWAT